MKYYLAYSINILIGLILMCTATTWLQFFSSLFAVLISTAFLIWLCIDEKRREPDPDLDCEKNPQQYGK